EAAFGLFRRGRDRARGVGEVLLAQRLADIHALGEQEGVGHPPADNEDIDLVHEITEEVELGRDLGAPDNRRKGPRRIAEREIERLELSLHRPSRMRGQAMGEALGCRMRAVGGGEGVVDIEIAQLGELGDMGRIVLLLALVKAGVLQQQNVAVLHPGDRVGGGLADAVVREGDRPPDDVADRAGNGLERIGLVRPALGPAKVRQKNDLAAFVGDLRDGWRDPLDTGRVGHPAVLGRHVEIDAQENALSGDFGVVEGAERFGHDPSLRNRTPADDGTDQISFAIATAVSAMRLENAHSLSYQESTRTKVPSMTLVWSRWKTEERSSPLKSLETFGWSV